MRRRKGRSSPDQRLRTGQVGKALLVAPIRNVHPIAMAVFRISAKNRRIAELSTRPPDLCRGRHQKDQLRYQTPIRAVKEARIQLCAWAPARLEWRQLAPSAKILYYRDTFSVRMIPYSHVNVWVNTGAFPRSHFSLQCIFQSH